MGVVGLAPDFFARGELGWHPKPAVDLFAYGQGAARLGAPVGWEAGVGARVRF